MNQAICELIITLLLWLPFIILGVKKINLSSIKLMFILVIIFSLNYIFLYLPLVDEEFKLIFPNSPWNWSGKLYATIICVVYLITQRRKIKDYFINLHQNGAFKIGLILILLLEFIHIIQMPFGSTNGIDFDSFLFQLTMPSIHEELLFRSIILGLLIKLFKPSKFGSNYALLLSAYLFGLGHAVNYESGLAIDFDFASFISTFVYGLFLAWLVLISKSIVLPIISHSLDSLPYIIL